MRIPSFSRIKRSYQGQFESVDQFTHPFPSMRDRFNFIPFFRQCLALSLFSQQNADKLNKAISELPDPRTVIENQSKTESIWLKTDPPPLCLAYVYSACRSSFVTDSAFPD
nr:unnamed protein product [Fasciola hepatica]